MTVGRIAVVGASAAGLAAVEAVRRGGWTGALTLIGDEPHLPYDRPPLSKQLLSGDWQADRLGLRTADQLDALDLDLRLGTRATALDSGARTLTLADGERLAYDGVIVATGVRARTLPGLAGTAGVHTLRTLDDALGLRAWLLGAPRRLVVAGNGVLGCEAAAVARELGHEVTLVGRDPLPMGRLVGEGTGALLAAEHERHGVRMLTGSLDGVETADGHVTGVRLTDGSTLDADTVLLAIGSEPAVDWLRADAALDTADGLRCDEYCAAAPGVHAAGDVARWYHPGHGRHLRIEHRMNATEQAMAAARNLLAELGVDGAERRPFTPVPYFWSDQYGMKLQAYGVLAGADRAETVLLDKDERRVAALYGRDGLATGVLAAGLPPRQIRGLRAVIATPGPWEEAYARLLTAVGAE
ncbi:FAD-dependent oxidoreductase [Streptomyces sp. Ru73]|uniref:NAD(P)/FAD-dependent oxidoreductase n=1 Tax=Streptomyces sp. Ru73 TaxID=2080748 RepID=UPI000CDDB0D4|nr:FAD-dependent oxidoreductase [Streptomyces sp. Ru73]POX41435.1 FAD-dependent oxidoreductase [Streptomyces sp. Ru73]